MNRDSELREAGVTQQQAGLTLHRAAAAPRDAPVTFSTTESAEPNRVLVVKPTQEPGLHRQIIYLFMMAEAEHRVRDYPAKTQ